MLVLCDIKSYYCSPGVLSKSNLPKFLLRRASGVLYNFLLHG